MAAKRPKPTKPTIAQHLESVRPDMTTERGAAMGRRSAQMRRLERMDSTIVWPKKREVTLAEAAVLLPYRELAIRRMIHRGELTAVSVGYNDIRISVSELKRWVRAQLDAVDSALTPEQTRRMLETLSRKMGL